MLTSETYTIADIAKMIDAEVVGDASATINSLAPISEATSGQLTYLVGGKYRQFLSSSEATAVILTAKEAEECAATKLIVDNPELCFATVAKLFERKMVTKQGVHPAAIVGNNCNIDPSVSVAANVVIGDNVSIGQNSVLMPGVVIGDGVSIGQDCIVYSNVMLYQGISIANRVIIHANSTLGSDGFGYAQDKGRWAKIPQLGSVVIHDDVEIGANVTIDRGAMQDTIIYQGVKIDNQVQIGHNVEIGANSIICGCVGIAGSAKIGRNCMIGGGCNVNGHIEIADQVILTGTTTAGMNINEPGMYSSGMTAQPHRDWGKIYVRILQLTDFGKRLNKLEKKCNDCIE